jgi:PKD repeat protein
MKARGKFLASIVAAFFVLTILATAAFAVPQTINFQGRLADSGGAPVNGTVNITFSIYDVATGGIPLWDEIQSGVTVTEGAFSVVLGSGTPIALPFDVQYYLGVKVDPDLVEMAPRAVLVSVPYAFTAAKADDANMLDGQDPTSFALQADVSTNTANISTNVANISFNAGNISTNAGNISINAANISANQTNISTNIANIDNNQTSISSHVSDTNNPHAVPDTLGGKTLSELVSFLDSRYGDPGGPFVAEFGVSDIISRYSGTSPLRVGVNVPVDFIDLTASAPISWLWEFGDSGTSTLQNPTHTYTSDGSYTVVLTAGDGVTSHTEIKVGYITVLPVQASRNTVDSAGFVGEWNSIAIGADGLPVISYLDFTNLDLKVAHCGDSICISDNTITTVDSGSLAGQYSSIAIGADGLPVSSYYNGSALTVLHCGDASCSTGNTINTVDASGVTGQYTSIAIGADNLPVISYKDATGEDLKVAHCGDAACSTGNTINTVDSFGMVGWFTSIAIGADNLPVISYLDNTNGNLKVAHCGDASCTPATNTITTVDLAGGVGGYSSIAIGTDGLPVISYFDFTNLDLKVAKCGDASCTPATNTITTVDSAGTVGEYTSIAIGADNLPVISYWDNTNQDLKVAHCGDAACTSGNTITTVDAAQDVGQHTSIAIGADGLPVISYYNFTPTYESLKVVHCGDAACSVW